MKVLCIGNAAFDITIPTNNYPVENTKYRIDKKIECGGGPASNAAYLMAKWGLDVYIAAVVGNDYYGNQIKKEFEEVKVNTKYLQVSNNYKTTSSYIIANSETGTRTILSVRDRDIHMSYVDIDIKPDVILMDGNEYQLSKKVMEKFPTAITIMDAGRYSEEFFELSKMVNHVVCSRDFAEAVSGITVDYSKPETLLEMYAELENIYSGNVVVTLEDKGCLYKIGEIVKIMPGINVKAVDSTGAGDIFHGAYTYGIATRLPLEEVLKLANIAGGLSVTKIGGKNSIPSLDEIEQVYNEIG